MRKIRINTTLTLRMGKCPVIKFVAGAILLTTNPGLTPSPHEWEIASVVCSTFVVGVSDRTCPT